MANTHKYIFLSDATKKEIPVSLYVSGDMLYTRNESQVSHVLLLSQTVALSCLLQGLRKGRWSVPETLWALIMSPHSLLSLISYNCPTSWNLPRNKEKKKNLWWVLKLNNWDFQNVKCIWIHFSMYFLQRNPLWQYDWYHSYITAEQHIMGWNHKINNYST